MATFGDLQSRVLSNIIDRPDYVQSRVPDVVREVIRELQGASHNFWVQQTLLEVTTSIAASPADFLVACPANFKEWHGKPWRQPQNGRNTKLEVFSSRKQAEDRWEYGDTGAPAALFFSDPSTDLGARNIHVRPFPDGASDYSDGEYRVKIPYFRFLTALSSSDDSNWLTVEGEAYIEYKATAKCFFLDHDEERGAIWEQRSAPEKANLLRLDKRLWMSATPTLTISTNAY